MNSVVKNLILNSKKAYKESIVIDNDLLQDILLDILTDIKKLQEMLDDSMEDNMEISKKITKKRYTYEEVKAITEIQVKLAKDEISFEAGNREILKISDRFPVHNLVQYNKQMQDRLSGTTRYGLAIPSNWAKALLEITDNDSMVIKALKEQQRLYKEKDGRSNQTLEDLLNGLDKKLVDENNIESKFREYTRQTVQNEITVDGYVKSLIEDLPLRLNIDSIFNIVDSNFLQNLYNRCSVGGDLHEWSYAIGNGRPMSAIKKYIDFLISEK